MSQAWHQEQMKAAGVAPELVIPHEEGPMCGGLHCHMCGVDEPGDGAFRRCFECGHVYRTAESLREAWAEATAQGYGLPPGTDVTAPPVEQIYGCPLCAHDW